MTRKTWTAEEIEQLVEARHNNLSLKIISKQLGKSQISVSKAVQRYGIGKKSDEEIADFIEQVRNKHLKRRIKRSYNLENYKKDDGWVPYAKVIDWLMEQNKQLDYNHLSPWQIVYIANKLRLSQGLRVFYVHELIET